MHVVVLAPHADDAEYGAGGLIALLAAAAHDLVIANFTPSDPGWGGLAEMQAILGVRQVDFLGFATGQIRDTDEARSLVTAYLDGLKPDLILSIWPVDEHSDHRGQASLAIHYVNQRQQMRVDAKGQIHPEVHCPQLIFYEALSGKQSKLFHPDIHIDLPAAMAQKKIAAMQLYNTSQYMAQAIHHHMVMMEFRALQSGQCRHAMIEQGVWSEAFASYPVANGQKRLALPGQK